MPITNERMRITENAKELLCQFKKKFHVTTCFKFYSITSNFVLAAIGKKKLIVKSMETIQKKKKVAS